MKVKIEKIDKDLPTPRYAYNGDAAMDVYSRINTVLEPGAWEIIPTGLKFAIPYGFEMQVRARSGLSAKKGISLVNGIGTIGNQYRGELGIIAINHGKENFEIKRGDRIAQVAFNKIEFVQLEEVEFLEKNTERGSGGFGSTGEREFKD